MNWTLITTTKIKKQALEIASFLESKNVNYFIYEIPTTTEFEIELVYNQLKKTTHCVMLLDETVSVSPIVLYLTGYVTGAELPNFIIGEKYCIAFNNKIQSSYCFENTKSLINSVSENLPAYLIEVEKKKALKKLFESGIPFTPDCFSFHIAQDNENECNLFYEAGMDVNVRDSAGTPMICIAARSGRKKMIDWLVENGADINAISKDRGYSAVMDAVWKSSPEIVDKLISLGADLNIVSNDGQTALVLATGASNTKICEMLARNGANPSVKDKMGMSALEYAQLFKKDKLVEIYKEYV